MVSENNFWIISNYNQNPSNVINELEGRFLICNQGEKNFVPEKYQSDVLYRESFHSGHNIIDYLEYIIDNYHNLPNSIGFIKGNLFPRHISKKIFLKRQNSSGFIPLYSDSESFSPSYIQLFKTDITLMAQQVAPGYYLEKTNNWYCKVKNKGEYFPKLEDFFHHFFNRPLPKYIPFIPGACMIVPKYKINRWPLSLYQEMYKAVTYSFFPVEAYHAERCMAYLFDFPSE
jgi:hypothetical protein